jgi:hypothetical protein
MSSWIRDALAASAPLLALAGVMIGHWMSRLTARELEARWRREETMRILRWAVDKVIDQDDTASRSGVIVLEALTDAELLHDADTGFLEQIIHGIMNVRSEGYPEVEDFEQAPGWST